MVFDILIKFPKTCVALVVGVMVPTTRLLAWIIIKMLFSLVFGSIKAALLGDGVLTGWYHDIQSVVTPVYYEYRKATDPPPADYFGKLIQYLDATGVSDYGGWFMLGSAGVLVAYSISGIVRRRFRSYKYARNGYNYESMMEGSSFSNSQLPHYQVSIEVEGMFSFNHNGYGLRIMNYLVVPMHVVGDRKELLIRYRGKTAQCSTSGIKRSLFVQDVAYLYIPADVWSLLGVGACKVRTMNEIQSQYVTCSGFKGASTGYLEKSKINWLMEYRGSTVNGYSGAAYHVNGVLMGMHLGCTGSTNMGVTAAVLFRELDRINDVRQAMTGESYGEEPVFGSRAQEWSVRSIIKGLEDYDRLYDQKGWADDDDCVIDYNANLGYDSEAKIVKDVPNKYKLKEHIALLGDLSAADVKQMTEDLLYYAENRDKRNMRVVSSINKPSVESPVIRLNVQSDGREDYIALKSVVKPMHMGDIIRDLQRRVTILEGKVGDTDSCKMVKQDIQQLKSKLEIINPAEIKLLKEMLYVEDEVFPCSRCNKQFSALSSVQEHFKAKHLESPIKEESVFPSDTKATVKMDKAFLGKRRSSPLKRSKISRRSLSSSVESTQSQLLAVLRSLMNDLQQSREQPSPKLQPAMAGPSSVNLLS